MSAPEPACSLHSARRLGWLALLALAVGLGLWLWLAPISSAVIVHGTVEPEGRQQGVQHALGGTVRRIHLREGDHVAAGQLMIELDGQLLVEELASIDARIEAGEAARLRLLAESTGQPGLYLPARPSPAQRLEAQLFATRLQARQREITQLRQRRQQIAAQIEGHDAQLAALARETGLLEEELAAQEALLAKGLAQARPRLAILRELARLAGDRGALQARRAEAGERQLELAAQIDRLQLAHLEAALQGLAEQDQSLRALRLRRAELSEDIRRLAIRAPVAGRVLALAVLAPGAVLRPAEILARITPDQPPQVALHLPAHLGARIHPGQSVELVSPRQGAGPPSHLRGTISLISADTLTDPTSGEAFYRVLVLPEILPDVPPDVLSGTMPAPGDTLRPGQPVEAFIETGQQSAFAWLIAPLRLHLARALRET